MDPKAYLYISEFKQFGDIDLLIDSRWIDGDWRKLITVMQGLQFTVHDEHEHEFSNMDDVHIGFASTDILVRDGITHSLEDALEVFSVNGIDIYTLKPQFFKKA